MAARAIWKGVLHLGELRVPVKLYSAIEDRNIHFRLLHRDDREPVTQVMVNARTDEVVPHDRAQRAYVTEQGDMVLLRRDELESLEPAKSRVIELVAFLPRHEVDHRWYDRPYYLGPDGAADSYHALATAMQDLALDGLARWTMRNKEYVGALGLYDGYLMLTTLRHARQVVPVEALEAPAGAPLDERELAMARQLIGMLEVKFEPRQYADEYRERVLELIRAKARGEAGKVVKFERRERADDLGEALKASLERARQHQQTSRHGRDDVGTRQTR